MREYFKNLNFAYIFIVSTVSFLWFILKQKTSYEWPAIDMMPFFERYKDSSFLTNDFFTNAISNEPNPRWIFGYFIILLSSISGADWYSVSYVLKVVLVVVTPALWYLVIFGVLKHYLGEKQLKSIQILLMIAILIVIYPRFSGYFSIAWWAPFVVQAMSQSLSLVFGLLAIVFSQVNTKKSTITSILLFLFATLVHPAVGLFMLLFYILTESPNLATNYKKYLALFIGGFIVPAILIMLVFKPSVALDTLNFVNIYAIENHSSHYHLKDFGTLSPVSWMYSFILIIALFLISIFYFYKTKTSNYLVLSLLFLLSYLLAVVAQYLFIDIFPSKTIASIGPVRFTFLGYWMVVISWLLMLSRWSFLERVNFELRRKKILLAIGGGTSLWALP